ncbi:MAG: NAD-dependent deacylase [Anaerolineaceae bacterium]|nr:NAD-dependent deacylase [Anaerolineaceae bacterium]
MIQRAAERLRNSQRPAVLTGAGVSKESGVPTFRDAVEGLWAKYDPMELATPGAFRKNPKLVWDWYEYRRGLVRTAQPNPGHDALAALESRFPGLPVITQNVDDLHEQAGSTNVIHLHGNIAESKCFFDCQGSPTLIDVSQLEWDKENGPPACPHCGRWVRPNVVWYGEMLPGDQLQTAMLASQRADVMLVIGTSGLVSPAASLPGVARHAGATLIEINPDYSAITRIADIKLDGPSGEIMPRLLAALGD